MGKKFGTSYLKSQNGFTDDHGHLVELGGRADRAVHEAEGEGVGPVARDPAEAEEGHAEHDDKVDAARGRVHKKISF